MREVCGGGDGLVRTVIIPAHHTVLLGQLITQGVSLLEVVLTTKLRALFNQPLNGRYIHIGVVAFTTHVWAVAAASASAHAIISTARLLPIKIAATSAATTATATTTTATATTAISAAATTVSAVKTIVALSVTVASAASSAVIVSVSVPSPAVLSGNERRTTASGAVMQVHAANVRGEARQEERRDDDDGHQALLCRRALSETVAR